MSSKERLISTAVPTAASKPAKPPCQIDAKAIISDKAVLVGKHQITIGANTVIHPYAKIDSTHGSIIIGEFCIIAEKAAVGFTNPDSEHAEVRIEDYVLVETGAIVEAALISKVSVVGAFAVLEPSSKIGQFCKIAAAGKVARGATLPDYTVILDDTRTRLDTTTSQREDIQQLKIKGQTMHVETLRRLIPSSIAKWQ